MKKIKVTWQFVITLAVFLFLLALAYLPRISHAGFLQDDWDTLFVTENRSPGELVFHFSIDRPLRGYFGLLEDKIFGTNLAAYQVSALFWRLVDTLALYLALMLVWPKHWKTNLVICSLVLVYPGFHEQPHAFDYQAHLFSRMSLNLSILLSLLVFRIPNKWLKVVSVFGALLLAQISYGLMDVYIGMEVLRLGLIVIMGLQQSNKNNHLKAAVYSLVYLVGAGAFTYWRLFVFESRRASVNAGTMLSGYSSPGEKLLENGKALAINIYRLVVSAFYKPLAVFGEILDRADWMVGVILALAAAAIIVIVISGVKPASVSQKSDENNHYSLTLILIGLAGTIGALVPVIFGGREITYVLSGDRFSYPGSISACILIGGLISLVKSRRLQTAVVSVLVFVSVLTQFSNNVIFEKNGDQTRSAWWQLSWRAPQLQPATLLSGRIAFGILDEDYTLWGPANLIYYPGNHEVTVTAEVLSDQTLPLFKAQGKSISERKGILFERDFGNLLLISKNENSCLHVIDGDHPEYSQADDPILQTVGNLSKIDQIEAESENIPTPRSDLFGSEPAHDWCYYYQKAQLARQSRDWQLAAKLGDEALAGGLSPNDPMEWLVFLQAFAYQNDVHYAMVLGEVTADPYSLGQACSVFTSYTQEFEGSLLINNHMKLLQDTCRAGN